MEKTENIKDRFCKKCLKCVKGCEGEINLPTSIWDELPEGCGFEGWVFQKKEEIKQKIRKQKEDLLVLEISLKNVPEEEKFVIENQIDKIKSNIEKYLEYGSLDW